MDTSGKIIKLTKGDDVALQYIGAAAVLHWASLPEKVQNLLWQQACAVGGLAPTTSLVEQMKGLVKRNA